MVVLTKLECDVAANSFKSRDCFNHGMLHYTFSNNVTARGYDASTMQLFKDSSRPRPISHSSTLMRVGDDGDCTVASLDLCQRRHAMASASAM